MKLLITGSSSGMGRWLAMQYCDAGHEVWGVARRNQADFGAERQASGQRFRSTRADISQGEMMEALRDEVVREWGQIDGLICCAGVQGPLGPAMKLSAASFSESLHVNLHGTFNTLLALHHPLLRASRRAKVICFSGGGSTGPRPFFTPYAVAKAGVVRMVENLAHEWKGLALDINALAPGAVNTRMTEEVIEAGPEIVGSSEHGKALEQMATGGTPLPKVRAVVDFLLSPESDGISGHLISGLWDPYHSLPPVREQLEKSDVFTLRRIVPEDRGLDWKSVANELPGMNPLRITVLGLWHLGSVTAACCAKHFNVTGLDFDEGLISRLKDGRAPILEPGLNDLLAAGLKNRSLHFTTDASAAVAEAGILWLCYDTPVNDQDESDVAFVLDRLRRALPHLPEGALVLISSQLPVGTCAALEKEFPQFHFACSPENLRLGKAIEAFQKAERVIVGIRSNSKRAALEELFKPFTSRVQFMRTESAEMVKHALNSFLAVSITFINEIARLCEHVGADAKEVAAGLKSEPRIGPKAYLGPGGPFAGGTLARDVVTLTQLGAQNGESLALIPAIKQSNDEHRGWALRQLQSRLGELRGKNIAILGLVYTPNTDTLRRSNAVELCQQVVAAGARVAAFDPAIKQSSPELAGVILAASADAALATVDAAVVCTEWPQLRELHWPSLAPKMRRALIIDANRFLEKPLQGITSVEHISVGQA